MNGDSSNTVVKTGAQTWATLAISTGDKELTSVGNHGFMVGPITVKPVNQHDTVILPETLTALVDGTDHLGIDRHGSALTLDAGVDSQVNQELIKAHQMKPVIYLWWQSGASLMPRTERTTICPSIFQKKLAIFPCG